MEGIAAIAIGLLYVSFSAPPWLASKSLIPADKWNVVVAIYLLGLVTSHASIHWLLLWLEKPYGVQPSPAEFLNEPEAYSYWPPTFVGLVEQILYPTALLMGEGQFIVFWLGIKVAGQWDLWGKGQKGRARFNRFLFGNALALMFAGLVYAAILIFVVTP